MCAEIDTKARKVGERENFLDNVKVDRSFDQRHKSKAYSSFLLLLEMNLPTAAAAAAATKSGDFLLRRRN